MNKTQLLVGLVGPSKSGKSTLKRGLEEHGYSVRHIAQEHSYVPDMWEKISNPEVLIFLDVSFPTSLERGHPDWKQADYEEEQKRLLHARKHANLEINTDNLPSEAVLEQVVNFLAIN